MPDLSERWDLVAIAINARLAELTMSQADLAQRAQINEITIRELQNEVVKPRRPKTKAAISRALGWTPDSIDLVLQGERPMVVSVQGADASSLSEGPDTSQMWRYIGRLEDRIWRLEELVEEMGEALQQATDDLATVADHVDEGFVVSDFTFMGFRPRRPQAGPNLWESQGLKLLPDEETQMAANTGDPKAKKGPRRKPAPPADQDDV